MVKLDHRRLAGVILVLIAACGNAGPAPEGEPSAGPFRCHSSEAGGGDDAGNLADSDAAGVWLTAPGFDDVTMTLKADGTYTWDNRTIDGCATGTWMADGTRLTFTFAEDDPFCAGETLTWEYQLEADTLTSEVVAETCPEAVSRASWEFKRQGAS